MEEEIFGYDDEYCDGRIEVALKRLGNSDPEYKKVLIRVCDTVSDLFFYYREGGEEIPKEYEDRLRDYFQNIRDVENVQLRTVYYSAVVDCITTLTKLGYIKM